MRRRRSTKTRWTSTSAPRPPRPLLRPCSIGESCRVACLPSINARQLSSTEPFNELPSKPEQQQTVEKRGTWLRACASRRASKKKKGGARQPNGVRAYPVWHIFDVTDSQNKKRKTGLSRSLRGISRAMELLRVSLPMNFREVSVIFTAVSQSIVHFQKMYSVPVFLNTQQATNRLLFCSCTTLHKYRRARAKM